MAFKMKYGHSAFPFKSSPAKFIGMGVINRIRGIGSGIGQAIGGTGEEAAKSGARHTHDEAGNAIPLTKKGSPAKKPKDYAGSGQKWDAGDKARWKTQYRKDTGHTGPIPKDLYPWG